MTAKQYGEALENKEDAEIPVRTVSGCEITSEDGKVIYGYF